MKTLFVLVGLFSMNAFSYELTCKKYFDEELESLISNSGASERLKLNEKLEGTEGDLYLINLQKIPNNQNKTPEQLQNIAGIVRDGDKDSIEGVFSVLNNVPVYEQLNISVSKNPNTKIFFDSCFKKMKCQSSFLKAGKKMVLAARKATGTDFLSLQKMGNEASKAIINSGLKGQAKFEAKCLKSDFILD